MIYKYSTLSIEFIFHFRVVQKIKLRIPLVWNNFLAAVLELGT